jgi:hypothetical protein
MNRINSLVSSALFKEGCKVNDSIITRAVEQRELKPEIFVAVDTHLVYRNSKIPFDKKQRKRACSDMQTVKGSKPKNGACYAHEYMTLQNIKMKDEPTYVLSFDRVLPLKDKTTIMKGLIEDTEMKTDSTIALIVADGGFDDVQTMKMCKDMKKHFVFRADKDKKVKASIARIEETGRDYQVIYHYVKGSKKHHVTVNLVILKVDWLKKQGITYPLLKSDYLTFFTDLAHNEYVSMESFCLKVALYYKKRWGIETGYRDIGAFEGKTHSLHDATRLFLYIQALILFNLWVQINLEFKNDPDRLKHFKKGIPKSTIQFLMEQLFLHQIEEEMQQGPLKN